MGVDAKAHEEFFRTWLADIVEPGRPFGLSEVCGDGSGTTEARRTLPQVLNARLRGQAAWCDPGEPLPPGVREVVARSSCREQVVFGTVLFGRMHGGAGAAVRWACSSTPCRCGSISTAPPSRQACTSHMPACPSCSRMSMPHWHYEFLS